MHSAAGGERHHRRELPTPYGRDRGARDGAPPPAGATRSWSASRARSSELTAIGREAPLQRIQALRATDGTRSTRCFVFRSCARPVCLSRRVEIGGV